MSSNNPRTVIIVSVIYSLGFVSGWKIRGVVEYINNAIKDITREWEEKRLAHDERMRKLLGDYYQAQK